MIYAECKKKVLAAPRNSARYFWAHFQAAWEGILAFVGREDPISWVYSFAFSSLAWSLSKQGLSPSFCLEAAWAAAAFTSLWGRLGAFRLRVWPARLFFSRALAWALLGWPSFEWGQDWAAAGSFSAEQGWPGWGGALYCLLAPILLAWFAGEARANLRPKGSRHGGVGQRLSYVLERYPFFWGLGCLPTLAPLSGLPGSFCFLLWVQAGVRAGEANSSRVFYLDPLEVAEDFLYSSL